MIVLAVISVIMISILIYAIIINFLPVINQPKSSSQFDVFRDMEPSSQTRENAWVGFLQDDVHRTSGGSYGDFTGNETTKVRVYPL